MISNNNQQMGKNNKARDRVFLLNKKYIKFLEQEQKRWLKWNMTLMTIHLIKQDLSNVCHLLYVYAQGKWGYKNGINDSYGKIINRHCRCNGSDEGKKIK